MRGLPKEPEAGAKHRFVKTILWMAPGLGKQVTGNVLDDELVVGDVSVERPDHVVTIDVGFRQVEVVFMSGCFRVAHQVEPMPAPAFPIMRGRQQAVHNSFKSM